VKKPSVHIAKHLLELFWPDFTVIKGCVFLKSLNIDSRIDVSYPNQTESDMNHTHILDLVRHNAGMNRTPCFKSTHPDFKVAYHIGRNLCFMWAYKLMQDFPRDNFRVYLHGFEPIVRFHKIRRGIPNWIEAKNFKQDIRAGKVAILDTSKMRKHNNSFSDYKERHSE
jgi:hypothetical protein